jgi:hypothetical protein
MLSLCHGILPKVVSALFTTLNWGVDGRGGEGRGGEGRGRDRGEEKEFVLSMFHNFIIFAGMISRVLSKKIVAKI